MEESVDLGASPEKTARNLTIVVPAFNEERHIALTLNAVVKAASLALDDYEIIVVDDGSRDATGRLADEAAQRNSRIRVVHQPTNQGVGAAFIIGLAEAKFESISVVPGDNAFSEATLKDVFGAVGTAPLIVSYRANMEVRTPIRRLLSIACTWSMRLITGRWIRDAHSMFVYPVALAREIKVQPGYGYHIESLGRLLVAAPSYREIPAILTPRPDANSGVMRFSVVTLLVLTMLRLACWRAGMMLSPGRGANKSSSRTTLGHMVLIGCAVAALVAAFAYGKALGIDKTDPSNRVRIHAIPVAISQIYHGRPHDYTAHYSIAITFQSELPLAPLISNAVAAHVPPNDRTYFWTADDRGLSDYVNMAFRLFGPRIASLYYFWFLLLTVSLTTALVCFRRDAAALAGIGSVMVAVGAILPAYVIIPFEHPKMHLAESRTFEVLGAVAAIHIVLALLRPRTVERWPWLAGLTAQIALLTFLLHTRSSMSWLFAAVIMIAVAVALFRRWRGQQWRAASMRPAITVTVLIASWLTMTGYQSVMLHPAYKGEIGPRPFWHNIVMGLTYSKVFRDDIKALGVSDFQAAESVLLYARERNDLRLPATATARQAMNSLGSYTVFDWRSYEQVARDLVLRELVAHPVEALKLVVWEKPKAIADLVFCKMMIVVSFCGGNSARDLSVRFNPLAWHSLGFLLVLTGGYYFATRRSGPANPPNAPLWPIAAATAWITLLGLLPSVIIYPRFVQLAGTLIFGTVTLYIALMILLIFLTSYVTSQAKPFFVRAADV